MFWLGIKHLGKKQSNETIDKRIKSIKLKRLNNPLTSEQRNKWIGENNAMFGKRGKLSLNFGKKHSEKTKEKMRESHLKKRLTDEQKEQIRIKNDGSMWTIKSRNKLSASLKGKYVGDKNAHSKPCYIDGKIFECARSAYENNNFNMSFSTFCRKIKSGVIDNWYYLKNED